MNRLRTVITISENGGISRYRESTVSLRAVPLDALEALRRIHHAPTVRPSRLGDRLRRTVLSVAESFAQGGGTWRA